MNSVRPTATRGHPFGMPSSEDDVLSRGSGARTVHGTRAVLAGSAAMILGGIIDEYERAA